MAHATGVGSVLPFGQVRSSPWWPGPGISFNFVWGPRAGMMLLYKTINGENASAIASDSGHIDQTTGALIGWHGRISLQPWGVHAPPFDMCVARSPEFAACSVAVGCGKRLCHGALHRQQRQSGPSPHQTYCLQPSENSLKKHAVGEDQTSWLSTEQNEDTARNAQSCLQQCMSSPIHKDQLVGNVLLWSIQ